MLTYALIGEKLGHSFSVPIHAAFGNPEYVLKEIPREGLDAFLTEKNFLGLNVTIPYKQDVMPYCVLDDAAKEIGAVNTIVNKNGTLYGSNTDAYGLSKMMDRALGVENADFSGKNAVILGSGGTAKTASYVLKEKHASKITVLARNTEKAKAVMAGKDVEVLPIHSIGSDIYKNTEILVNTTPVGMFPHADEMPVGLDSFTNLKGVFDVIYNPLCTKLVAQAAKRGIPAANGLYMLVMQALKAEVLFGKNPQSMDGERVERDLYKNLQNIVLIGMPGSGKSTLGKALAESMKRGFVDTDEEFLKEHGITPGACIEKFGEEIFREKEMQTVRRISLLNHMVIATGGGVVTRPVNVDALKQNGKVVYIKRDIRNLSSEGRPLSMGEGVIEALYEKRKSLYESAADVIYEIKEGDVKGCVEEIRALCITD